VATYKNGSVSAPCPDCGGAITTFERMDGARELGVVFRQLVLNDGRPVQSVRYVLTRCAGCGRGGLATIHEGGGRNGLAEFYPTAIDLAPVPPDVPTEICKELREAELCAAHGAFRAASALLRSTLEKTLLAAGYETGSLYKKIEAAAGDGTLTDVRRQRAHDEIRVLGNDILHDAYREVGEEEYTLAHHYTQRILEDFYDNRTTTKALLLSKGRKPT
jgi:hypothetical protein